RVDPVDAANHILAAGDLVLEFALPGVDQVEVAPAVALRSIDDFLRLVKPVDQVETEVLDVSGPDKGLRLLVDQAACLAVMAIDRDDAETLMAAIHLFIGEGVIVALPVELR